jgi:hypothetical protein
MRGSADVFRATLGPAAAVSSADVRSSAGHPKELPSTSKQRQSLDPLHIHSCAPPATLQAGYIPKPLLYAAASFSFLPSVAAAAARRACGILLAHLAIPQNDVAHNAHPRTHLPMYAVPASCTARRSAAPAAYGSARSPAG